MLSFRSFHWAFVVAFLSCLANEHALAKQIDACPPTGETSPLLGSGAFTVEINDFLVSSSEDDDSPATIRTGLEFDLVLSPGVVSSFQALLIRVEGTTTVLAEAPFVSPTALCDGTVGSVLNNDITLDKTTVTVSVQVEEPTDLVIDVFVVVVSEDGTSSITYSSTIQAEARILTNLVDFASSRDDLSSLVSAVESADLVAILSNPDASYTLFAPTNEAFEKGLDAKFLTPPWFSHLQAILAYHVVTRFVRLQDLTDGRRIGTVLGEGITISRWPVPGAAELISLSGNEFQASVIVQGNLPASNGLVHVVDGVFLPTFLALNLVDVLKTERQLLGEFASLLVRANLEDIFSTDDMTLLAPTDDAFAALPPAVTAELVTNEERLRTILMNHALPGVYPSRLLTDGRELATLAAPFALTVSVPDPTIVNIEDAKIIENPAVAGNGIIHVLDKVLIPSRRTLLQRIQYEVGSEFSTLAMVVELAGLSTSLNDIDSNFTLFAPNDEAFVVHPKLLTKPWYQHLQAIVHNHVVEGTLVFESGVPPSVQTLQGSSLELLVDASGTGPASIVALKEVNVLEADVLARNGIWHTIDGVLLPPFMGLPALEILRTIDTTNNPYSFSTLIDLITVAGVESEWMVGDALTLLAPTDEAFATNVGEGILEALRDDIPDLIRVLQYHVAPDVYPFSQFHDGLEIPTLLGSNITVEIGVARTVLQVLLNGVVPLVGSELAGNGVVLVLDGVLVPPVEGSTAEGPPPSSNTTAAPTRAPAAGPVDTTPVEPPATSVSLVRRIDRIVHLVLWTASLLLVSC